tara:strand:- start:768 stop:1148 length:381 start_codon:yes stop_codon:yes gene_type:complete
MEKDKDFLEYVVKNLVDHPDDVSIDRTIDERGVLLTLKVHPEDMGKVIGREGATAKAMRALLRTIGAQENARVNLKIEEPEGSTRAQVAPAPEGAPVPTPVPTPTPEPVSTEPVQDVESVVEDLKL